jgi:hypothetical protein
VAKNKYWTHVQKYANVPARILRHCSLAIRKTLQIARAIPWSGIRIKPIARGRDARSRRCARAGNLRILPILKLLRKTLVANCAQHVEITSEM